MDHAALVPDGQGPTRADRIVGCVLAAVTACFWLWLWAGQGPVLVHDSYGYLALESALQQGSAAVVERPDRTPGYPLFLLACGGIAALGGWERLTVAMVVQTLLLSGLGTWLVFDLGRRLGGLPVAVLAALVYATDVDLQMFGRYVLSEAQAVTLVSVTAWLRIRDGHWGRARWAAAALALTRPNLACVAGGLAGLDLLRGRTRSALSLAWPTLALLAGWVLFAHAAGGSPIDASRRIQALCQFGTAYRAELWKALPAGELRTALERAAQTQQHPNPYRAAGALTGQRAPWNPGADWRPIAAAAAAMIRADPLGYAQARLSLIPAVYRDSAVPWAILVNAPTAQPPDPWQRFARMSQPYHAVFFGSFSLFAVVLAVAVWNGFGFAPTVEPMRLVIAPLLVIIWVSTAMLSLSNFEIGRLGLPGHPLTALVWALGAARVLGGPRRD